MRNPGARRQPDGDQNHPYGHGKIEFLSAGFFSLLLLALGLCIMAKAIYTIVRGDAVTPSFLAVGPALVSILVNIAISNYGLCVGREINSPVIVANAKENRADAFSSIASLIGIVGALLGFTFLDPLGAVLNKDLPINLVKGIYAVVLLGIAWRILIQN